MHRVVGIVTLWLVALLTLPAAAAPCGTLTLAELRSEGVLPRLTGEPLAQGSAARAEYEIGDTKALWTYDLSVMPPSNIQVPSTCRGKGDTAYVFVADDVWETAVTQADVDAIVTAFDTATPRWPDQGIYASNTTLFGAPPDVDGDPRIIVFIYEIATYQGNAFDGFFRAEDELPFDASCATNPMKYCSNEAEMIHVNANEPGSEYMLGVMAHEFQHMIHFNHDQLEESWINESMSELAMSYNGYGDEGNLHYYIYHHDAALVTTEFVDYGAVFLFGTYLYERFDAPFVTALVANTATGVTGLGSTLDGAGLAVTFPELFRDWALANVLDAPDVGEGLFGYELIDYPEFTADETYDVVFMPSFSMGVSPFSFGIVELAGLSKAPEGKALSVTCDSSVHCGLAVTLADGGEVAGLPGDDGAIVVDGIEEATVLLVVANPTATTAAGGVTVSFVDPVEPPVEVVEPVTGDEIVSEEIVEEIIEGGEDTAIGVDTVSSGDTASPSDDTTGDPTGNDGGSGGDDEGCSATPSQSAPRAGAALLLLLAMAIIVRRRVTQR